MARITTTLLAFGVATMLVLTGCGDDDDGGAAEAPAGEAAEEADDNGSAPAEADSELDLCSLLEVAEIEAEFGTQGPVLEGQEELSQCTWEVGEDQSELGTGTVHVFVQEIPEAVSAEDTFAEQRASYADAVEIDGLGDAAYYEAAGTSVNVRSGDRIWFVQAAFLPEVPDTQAKLENLAAAVEGRL